jgi:small subunit ribosomal protein S20
MPHSHSAAKRLRQSKKRHRRRQAIISEIKGLVKKYSRALSAQNADEAKKLLKTIVSKLSRASSRGVIHKNTAARRISRLTRKLNIKS